MDTANGLTPVRCQGIWNKLPIFTFNTIQGFIDYCGVRRGWRLWRSGATPPFLLKRSLHLIRFQARIRLLKRHYHCYEHEICITIHPHTQHRAWYHMNNEFAWNICLDKQVIFLNMHQVTTMVVWKETIVDGHSEIMNYWGYVYALVLIFLPPKVHLLNQEPPLKNSSYGPGVWRQYLTGSYEIIVGHHCYCRHSMLVGLWSHFLRLW